MNMLKKTLLLVCMMALVVCISVGATIAYLTDDDAVINTFTVGNVQIELWETDTDGDNNKDDNHADGKHDKANEYHLLPGQTYVKDPTVTIKAKSEDAYIRMMVTVDELDELKAAFPKEKYSTYYNGDLFLLQMLVSGWNGGIWEYETFDEATATYEFRYHTAVGNDAETDKTIEPLFTHIVIPGSVTNDELAHLAKVEINVVAHAIQQAGFENDEDSAWTSFKTQNP